MDVDQVGSISKGFKGKDGRAKARRAKEKERALLGLQHGKAKMARARKAKVMGRRVQDNVFATSVASLVKDHRSTVSISVEL